jgi:hypothetical protein
MSRVTKSAFFDYSITICFCLPGLYLISILLNTTVGVADSEPVLVQWVTDIGRVAASYWYLPVAVILIFEVFWNSPRKRSLRRIVLASTAFMFVTYGMFSGAVIGSWFRMLAQT